MPSSQPEPAPAPTPGADDDWLNAQLLPDNPASAPPEITTAVPLSPMGRLLLQRQASFARCCSDEPLTPATFAKEVTMVARLAVADANYSAAEKLYKLVGQHINAIAATSDTHQHVHLHGPQVHSIADLARQSDASLRAIIEEAREATNARANPAPASTPAPAADPD